MNKILSLSFIFCLATNFAQNLHVSDSLSIGSSNGNYHPQIELNMLKEPLVLWTNPANKAVYISKKSNSNFSAPLQLNPMGLDVQTYNWSGPDLAIENQNVYVVFRSDGYETGHIYLVKSSDNGSTFSDTMRVDFLSQGYAQYPDIAVLNDTLFTIYMAHDDATGANPQYVLSRSFDGGLTFENKILAGEILGDEACDCCPAEIVVNKEIVAILFRNNASNIRDIKGVVSFDRGNTFTQIMDVDTHNWLLQSCPSTGPDARINSQNKLFSTYKSLENTSSKVFFNAYDISTNSSLTTLDLSSGIANGANYPQIALQNDTIAVVFEGVAVQSDVFLMYSFSGENGFNVANRMNLTNISGYQNKPDIAISNGIFHVVFSDNSDLKYLEVSENLSISEKKLSTSKATIIFSKERGFNNFHELIGTTLFDISGHKIKITEDDISKLSFGTYFITNEQSIQKLIITP